MGRESRRIVIGWVLLLQVLCHICSSTLFIHSHIIDGHKIVHSHFFAGPIGEHSHTSSSAESIERSTYFEATPTAIIAIEAPVCYITDILTFSIEDVAIAPITHHSLRAPPHVA